MAIDLNSTEQTFTQLLFKLKFYIAAFIGVILLLSFVLTKAHPQRKSYAKDYNYLYSLSEDLKAGREVSFDMLEAKLENFSTLRPQFDAFFIDEHVKSEEFEKANAIFADIRNRIIAKDALIDLFTEASLAIEKSEFKSAYEKCLRIHQSEGIKEGYPTLFSYNLFRLQELEKHLGKQAKAEKSKNELISFLDSLDDSSSINITVLNILKHCVKDK
ncbi:MAG: hypothetical protein S4CHLAM20_05910 [Chlamydiia bacterium]|nr:hypothetical protein [Chlamydiia bacterium]